ncbi:MAG: hypothetical protein HUJ71_00870 [Pseudobutyrivibrio sp.]|nr:hypothetical protein [Pseudobutyrivibrio sp.]
MGAQDRTEKVLREMHVQFSKATPYEGSAKNVIIDKLKMMDLLKELNECMYEMMEEYELTAKAKDKASRDLQKQGDDIIFDATRKAEDIYAASLMYTDNALGNIQDIMKESREAVKKIYDEADQKILDEIKAVKSNQGEIKSHLNDLIDTQKYLRLIDEENLRQLREKAEGKEDEFDAPKYAQAEVHINKDYFAAQGIALEDEPVEEATDEEKAMMDDLDAEYFAWAESQEEGDKKNNAKKGLGLFSKKH